MLSLQLFYKAPACRLMKNQTPSIKFSTSTFFQQFIVKTYTCVIPVFSSLNPSALTFLKNWQIFHAFQQTAPADDLVVLWSSRPVQSKPSILAKERFAPFRSKTLFFQAGRFLRLYPSSEKWSDRAEVGKLILMDSNSLACKDRFNHRFPKSKKIDLDQLMFN